MEDLWFPLFLLAQGLLDRIGHDGVVSGGSERNYQMNMYAPLLTVLIGLETQ